ncbi:MULTISPECIES: peptidylprolyl isomerase [Geomonas]|uniref:Peptidylprolyl isomerase n=1 Tax=Geomonas anaerohicana TaxID=2798583 RepID=A0ABS0YHE2_9BACT|nr:MULTISPECIES: peptidylprolyl isomerase [Geomonas]MBJ6751715.1 peptidylprolyl isomerase [Geomonas anaerohicana]MBU5611512.1 peptidylprolyl isomerase [Geomonas azotofigens]
MLSLHKMTRSAAALSLLALAACTGGPAKNSPQAAVEKVNGAPITRAELDRTVKALVGQADPKQLPPDQLKKATDAALNQLTAAELLYQAGMKLEIKDLDKQVTTRIVQSKYQYPSQAEFDKALQSVGMTQKELEEAARKDIVINNLIVQRFAGKTDVSEAEVRKYYEDNKLKQFTQGDRIKVSHILIGVAKGANAEAKQQAKDKALAVLKRVKGGEAFALVAKKESTSPTKEQGGSLGIIGKGQSLPPFEKAAFALKAGEISDVVETPLGYHVIKVEQKLPPATERYEDVKNTIAGNIKREKIRGMLAAYVEELRGKAKIEKV